MELSVQAILEINELEELLVLTNKIAPGLEEMEYFIVY